MAGYLDEEINLNVWFKLGFEHSFSRCVAECEERKCAKNCKEACLDALAANRLTVCGPRRKKTA